MYVVYAEPIWDYIYDLLCYKSGSLIIETPYFQAVPIWFYRPTKLNLTTFSMFCLIRYVYVHETGLAGQILECSLCFVNKSSGSLGP